MNAILGVALAMVFGLVLNRIMKLFNMPNVTGYLIAGIIVGPYCLKFLTTETVSDIGFVTTIALGFIAFSIGGEFKISTIKKLGMKILSITFLQAFGAVILVMASLFVVRAIKPDLVTIPMILLLSAISTATAPAATLMVVRQYKAHGPVTDTLLPVVAFDDAIGLIVFSICFGISKALMGGGAVTAVNIIVLPLAEIFFSLLIGGALGAVLALLCSVFKSRANRLCCIITFVLVAVGLCELSVKGVSLSSLLTCMMVGAVFCNLRKDSEVILDGSDRWTPPVFMLFFILSGANLDLKVVPYIGVIGVVYILARALGKYFGAYLGAVVTKSDKHVRNHLGITLLPQAGVAIGMSQMVAAEPELQSISGRIVTVVLCATLVYELIGPVLTKMSLKTAGEIEEGGKLPITELFDKLKGLGRKKAVATDGEQTRSTALTESSVSTQDASSDHVADATNADGNASNDGDVTSK